MELGQLVHGLEAMPKVLGDDEVVGFVDDDAIEMTRMGQTVEERYEALIACPVSGTKEQTVFKRVQVVRRILDGRDGK